VLTLLGKVLQIKYGELTRKFTYRCWIQVDFCFLFAFNLMAVEIRQVATTLLTRKVGEKGVNEKVYIALSKTVGGT